MAILELSFPGLSIFPRTRQNILGFILAYPMPMNMGHAGFRVNVKANLHITPISLAERRNQRRGLCIG